MTLLFFAMLIWFVGVIIGDYISVKELISSVHDTISGKKEEIIVPPNPYRSGAKGVSFIKQLAIWNLFLYKVDVHYRFFREWTTCPYPPSFFYKHGEEEARKIIDRELADLIELLNERKNLKRDRSLISI